MHTRGRTFLTMELVEGEDLAERLSHGPIALGEALDYARQIAEGLEEAHEKDIVHRDLKPANVKITTRGPRQDPGLRPGSAPTWETPARGRTSPTLRPRSRRTSPRPG